MELKAKIEKGILYLEVPLQAPVSSASGKTLVIATTRGNIRLDGLLYDGKPVNLGINAYIARS